MKSDFDLFLEECSLTREDVDRVRDLVPYLPFDCSGGLYLGDSFIDGTGVYTSRAISAGTLLGKAYFNETWTALGRFMNHSPNPNVKPLPFEGGFEFMATQQIRRDEELTCNYRDVKAIVPMEAEVKAFVNRCG